jgi:hypothetical protein
MEPGAQILTYGAHGVLRLLNSHKQEFTLCCLVEIRNVLEDAEELEPGLVRGP